MARSRSASSRSANGLQRSRRAWNASLGSAPSCSATARATCSATAGAEVSPGESKQAMLKNPGASSGSPMTKSSPSAHLARRPAKFAIMPRALTSGQVFFAESSTNRRPSALVDRSVLLACSTAFGPTSRLPCTVGVTSTPLPADDGAWNTVRENSGPYSVS